MLGKILVAHRNELILEVIQEMLQDIGYAVILSTDGHRALGKAMSGNFNLIIVNHTLTGNLNGSQLVEYMRKYGVQVPIVGIAPETTWDFFADSAKTKIDYILPCPFDYTELAKVIYSLLNRRKGSIDFLDISSVIPNSLNPLDTLSLPSNPSDKLEPLPSFEKELLPNFSKISIPKLSESEVNTFQQSSNFHLKMPDEGQGNLNRILLADPNDVLREQVTQILTRNGYEVTPLSCGQEAFEATMLNNYELILTDLWLVGMDGFEMIEAIRKSGVTSHIAIHTAHITREMVQEILGWNICKIFLKPAKSCDILSLIQHLVEE